jgi:hypothetical protein
MPADPALVQGFRIAFLGAAIIAACGIAIATLLTKQKQQKPTLQQMPQAPYNNPPARKT